MTTTIHVRELKCRTCGITLYPGRVANLAVHLKLRHDVTATGEVMK